MKLKMAGNTNLGCVRKNNEDNFCASADLQAGKFANASSPWGAEQVVDLGPKGVLLVVADGMGGTNAGEVASERAVVKVAEFFAPDRITDEITSRKDKILNFMEQSIVACDREVKGWGDSHPESKGMGTTMVIGWILDGKLYVAWCGDSRAYVYRPSENKIYQVSKDHSYVQLLVDKEMLTREETFDHPQGNIITRSLSHGQPAARPESLPDPYELCDGDIVLLCSDGLSGMLHDEEMADIISNSSDDLEEVVNNLINGARRAGGSDNITVVLCKVESGGKGTDEKCRHFFAKTEAALNGPGVPGAKPKTTPLFPDDPVDGPPQGPITTLNCGGAPAPALSSAPATKPVRKNSKMKFILPAIIALAVLALAGGSWFAYNQFVKHKAADHELMDTLDSREPDSGEEEAPDGVGDDGDANHSGAVVTIINSPRNATEKGGEQEVTDGGSKTSRILDMLGRTDSLLTDTTKKMNTDTVRLNTDSVEKINEISKR